MEKKKSRVLGIKHDSREDVGVLHSKGLLKYTLSKSLVMLAFLKGLLTNILTKLYACFIIN
jgi:hypothetical protein